MLSHLKMGGDDIDHKDTPYRVLNRVPRSQTKQSNTRGPEDESRPKTSAGTKSPSIADTPKLGETDTGVSLDYAQWNGAPKHPSRSMSLPISSPTTSPRAVAVEDAGLRQLVLSGRFESLSIDQAVYAASYGVPAGLAMSLQRGATVKDVCEEAQNHYRVASPAMPRSARPLSASRPQLTRLTSGLRESKPASRRVVIKDPEEILRMRRKLLATNKTKPSLNVKSIKTYKECHHDMAKPEEHVGINSTSKQPENKAKSANNKDKKKKSIKNVGSKDLVLTNIESDDELLESLDELKVKSPRKVQKPRLLSDDDLFDDDNDDHSRSSMEGLSDSDDDENTPVYKLEELIPKHDEASAYKEATQPAPVCKEKEKEKPKKFKSKLDIGKKLIKKLYKAQSAKVVPLETLSATPCPPSAEELTKIATTFCVETEAQASLRRYMKGQFIEEDYEGHFKPGVWDCEIAAGQEQNGDTDSDSDSDIIDDPRPGAVSRNCRRSIRSRRKVNKK